MPIDYVDRCRVARRAQPGAAGKTFHLVDPNPLTAREVFEGVAAHANTASRAAASRAHSHARCCARPGSRGSAAARSRSSTCSITPCTTIRTNTAHALAGTPVHCPALADYLPVLVNHVLEVSRGSATDALEEIHDPLD